MPVEGLLLFIFIFVPTWAFHLLPGAVLLRRRDWGWAVGCLVLGAVGIPLFIPWVAAVILAARRSGFIPLRRGSPVPILCRVLGVGLVLLAGVLIFWGLRDYRQAADLSMLDFYSNVIINSIVGCVGLLIAGIFLTAVPSLPGKGMWGGLMAVPALLMRSSSVTVSPVLLIILILVLLAASLGISVTVLLHTAPPAPAGAPSPVSAAPAVHRPSAPSPKAAPLTARLRCISGQYAGAEFPLADGETLCLGSSPDLAHLVLTQGGVAPLHGEITYQREQDACLLAHTGPVFCGGRELPQICMLHSGDMFSLGTPQQRFQVQI